MRLISVLSFFIKVEVILSLRIASLLIPVSDESLRLVLAGVVGSLLNYEVTVHFQSYNIYKRPTNST